MRGKIDLEGHFAIQDTAGDSERYFDKDIWPKFAEKILGFTNIRLEEMDQYGIEKMILSLNSPAVQAIADKKRAVEVAKRSNDIMANIMQKRPDRFLGFAALPLQEFCCLRIIAGKLCLCWLFLRLNAGLSIRIQLAAFVDL